MKAASKRVMKRAWQLKKEDSNYIWSECLKMAWVEEKAGQLIKAKKAAKSNTKVKASDAAIEIQATQIIILVMNKQIDGADLFGCKREVLIQVMKELHVKKWYRIYDKETMITNILDKAA